MLTIDQQLDSLQVVGGTNPVGSTTKNPGNAGSKIGYIRGYREFPLYICVCVCVWQD